MLRITRQFVADGDGRAVRLILEGRIIDEWVDELRRAWSEMCVDHSQQVRCQVDLEDVTYVSAEGAKLLREMDRLGVSFHATSPLVQASIQELRSQ